MSTFAVTAERLEVFAHPNADALELAQVGLYRAVVAKGAFKTGDYAIYIPEQAVLPENLIEEFGLTGRLAGSQANRLKAVRLRGELSQGLVVRPSALADVDLKAAAEARTDFSEILGITKWVPEVPAHMGGDVESAADLLGWVDIENIRRFPNIFNDGEPVSATEKIHGTATLFTLVTDEDGNERSYVSSKGLGARGLALKQDDSNLYWRAVRAHNIDGFARDVRDTALRGLASKVAIYGETFGAGVQDLSYGARAGAVPGFQVFDIRIEVQGESMWLTTDEVRGYAGDFGIGVVRELYRGPYSHDAIVAAANGKETVSGKELHIREGVVVRPLVERHSDVTGGRAIGKWVSDAYLLRKGGTEFE